MARRLFMFKCEESHITESFVDETVKEIKCYECDGKATRIISPPRIYLEPFSGDHPSASDRWERNRAEKLRLERKQNS